MSCNHIRSVTSEYLDDRVLNEDRAEIEDHLKFCRSCVEHVEVSRRLKSNLKRLPVRVPPARLRQNLMALASVERARVSPGSGFDWRDRLSLMFGHLMRPFAVPAMGGIVSAIVLFSAIMPQIAIKVRPMLNDVPTNLFTDATAKYSAPIGMSESEFVFDITVGSDGRVVDYTVVSGSELLRDSSFKRQVENNLLFTEFTPATLLGGRTSGRVRVQMKGDHINIRG